MYSRRTGVGSEQSCDVRLRAELETVDERLVVSDALARQQVDQSTVLVVDRRRRLQPAHLHPTPPQHAPPR